MADPNRIRGDAGVPYGPERPKEEAKIDPEKFKKVLKIDESDEAQKRHKRRLKKEEEEGDDEGVQAKTPPSPANSFSEFMSDKKEVSSLFDSESGGVLKRAAAETPPKAPPSGMIKTDSFEVPPDTEEEAYQPPPPLPPSERGAPPAPFEGQPPEAPGPFPLPEEETPTYEGVAPPPTEITEAEKPAKKKESDASLLASQPEKGALKKKKTAAKPQPRIETLPPKAKEKGAAKVLPEEIAAPEKIAQKPLLREALPKAASKKLSPFERFTPEEIRIKKLQKGGEALPLAEGFEVRTAFETEVDTGREKKESKDEFPFIDASELTAGFPSAIETLPPATPVADVPSYAKLTPEVYELFEKMAGTIIVQQSSGITTTTITINMPNSVFNGSEVILDHYSTAPNSFNVQLVGNPQAVSVFNENLGDLVAAFKQGQYAFEVNLLKPALATKKPLIRRKSAAGDKEGKKKQ